MLKKPEYAIQIYQYLLANPDFEQDMLTKDPEPASEQKGPASVNHSSLDMSRVEGGSMMRHRLGSAMRKTVETKLAESQA